MSSAKLKEVLSSDKALADHLDKCYAECRGEHAKSKWSWAKSSWRGAKSHKLQTAEEIVDKTVTAGGIATGAISFTSGAAATGLATLGAAISLYALPTALTAYALIKWGYNKNQKHIVNADIWEFWKKNVSNGDIVGEEKKLTNKDQVVKWLAWFGDTGLENMSQLEAKNDIAQKEFDEKSRMLLELAKMTAQMTTDKTRRMNPKELERQKDDLARKWIELGKDLEYIRYRLHRHAMYYEMMSLAAKCYLSHTEDDRKKIRGDVQDGIDKKSQLYLDLGKLIQGI